MYCKGIKSIGLATNLQINLAVENQDKDKADVNVSLSADPQSPKEAIQKALAYVIGEFVKVMWGNKII